LKKIEFFGLPCTGKTYVADILRNKLLRTNNIVHTHSSAFFEFIFFEKNITILEYISLQYYKYFKLKKISSFSNIKRNKNLKKKKISFKNPLSNKLYNTYINLCKKLSKKNNSDLKKIIFKKIEDNPEINNSKRNAKLWFIEFFAYQYIVTKYYDKIDFLIDDESLFQKIFIFSNVSNSSGFIKKYLNLVDKPYLLILVESTIDNILSRSKKRENSSKFHYQNMKHLINMIKYKKNIKKNINIKKEKIIIFQNNHNYLKQIKSIYERIKK